MFSSRGLRGNTTINNKENAILGSVSRTGKAGLLSTKDSVSNGISGKIARKPAPFGSPSQNVLTPRTKQPEGKQQKVRTVLREATRTPSAGVHSQKPTATQLQGQLPKTIRRHQGLFSTPAPIRSRTISSEDSVACLEPEYAPPRPKTPIFDAIGEFGWDLDTSLVPMTQLSTSRAYARELPAPDLELEQLVEISDMTYTAQHLSSQGNLETPMLPLISCKSTYLVAHALYPTRIPRLKRKR
ncbi:hypothetical protein COEREDRAFT_7875 [Coemansia reversa NRRL 1564]|uniref:Uncharacterized protein n=1 Tax=Coemansia reversa (strain ATCC 12441 / NRRL 1564) TaxID=763665 RepID=A0A2G5BDL6_COERN|nr:hypothetical protein COEREDRAFT_7875 [Coemansia reversa NRRL 1564]|eukprot:PIA17110.1 hypothetical protein COEREDRAFT_7875 [Coemansia reversa NRRL 1564]